MINMVLNYNVTLNNSSIICMIFLFKFYASNRIKLLMHIRSR